MIESIVKLPDGLRFLCIIGGFLANDSHYFSLNAADKFSGLLEVSCEYYFTRYTSYISLVSAFHTNDKAPVHETLYYHIHIKH